MKNIPFLMLFVLVQTGLFAQTPSYQLPGDFETGQLSISFEKVKASSSSYFINYTLQNKGNGHIFSQRNENSLWVNGGKSRPTSDLHIIGPGEKKLIYNEMRVKAPMTASAGLLELEIKGLQYAPASRYFIDAGQFTLAEGATQKVGNFEVKARDYKVREDRIFVEIKVTYVGDPQHVGALDLTGVRSLSGKAEIVKKGDLLQSGKYYTFAVNVYTTDANPVLEWGDAFQERILQTVDVPKMTIQSAAFAKMEAEAALETPATAPQPVAAAGCALSYTDFNILEKDIRDEANSGGNPVGLASEFMLNKSCLNTDQVVELLAAFNMDGHRLDFAKMAYRYCSDKNRYSRVIQGLSYNKNKEALEEFLSSQ